MSLPFHPRIRDSLNRPRTLATVPESFEFLTWSPIGDNPDASAARTGAALVLGLGPCPADAARLLEGRTGADEDERETAAPDAAVPLAARRQVAWVECPDFERALAAGGAEPLPPPPHWVRLTPDEALRFAAETRPAIWTYRQARRLFPDFWAPLFGRLEASATTPGLRRAARTVLLPGGPRDLLHLELWDALTAEGYQPLAPPRAGRQGASLVRRLEARPPAFCLSVNLRGLDPGGETFHLLEALGVPVVLWFVDNPWHIVSALRLPWWKKAVLFVSDATFSPELRRHGAERVYPLPLAASPLFRPRADPALPAGARVLFVGRSTFPGRDAFFGASHPPVELSRRAETLLERGGRPGHPMARPRRTRGRSRGRSLFLAPPRPVVEKNGSRRTGRGGRQRLETSPAARAAGNAVAPAGGLLYHTPRSVSSRVLYLQRHQPAFARRPDPAPL